MSVRLRFTDARVLAVVAHPDDAEILCAGTLARARDDGAAVGICVLCRGDRGQPATPVPDLSERRRAEMQESARLLGAELMHVGVPDGTLTDDGATRQALLEHVRAFRPTLILAHAPQDYHPDHQAASKLVESVSWFSASRGQTAQAPPLDQAPAVWLMDTVGMHAFAPGFYVDITPYTKLKQQMLACHRSQLQRGRDGDFAPLSELMQQQYLARGRQADVAAAEAFCLCPRFRRVAAW